MPKRDSQHYQFAYKAIPILFHNQSKDFLKHLEQDGVKFLKFYWDYIATETDDEGKSSSDGMGYEIRKIEDGKKMVLLTLPRPRKPPEAYFLALITPPPKRSLLPWQNHARVVGLEYHSDATHLCDLTPRAIRVDQGIGPRPVLEDFYIAVCKLMKMKEKAGHGGEKHEA
jgi:hypothetical protein